MKPIYECLDYLLDHLHENRFKPEGHRIKFDVDNKVLPDLNLQNHEEFKGLMDMLIEDKYAMTLPRFNNLDLEDYKINVMITPKGIDLKDRKGFTQKFKDEAYENTQVAILLKNQKFHRSALTWLTVILAVASAIAALYYWNELYWKYGCFHFCH